MDSSTSVNIFPPTEASIIKYLQQVGDNSFCSLYFTGKYHNVKILFFFCKIVSSPEHVGLSSNTAWLLGHFYTASTSSAITKTSSEYEKQLSIMLRCVLRFFPPCFGQFSCNLFCNL